MAEPALQVSSSRFLTFRIDAQLYALRADEVTEVIRVPAIARLPQGPKALLGLANLRGAVLPLVSLRQMLGKPFADQLGSSRAIVLDIGTPVALVVDSVATLESADAAQIEQNELSADNGEKLLGAFSFGTDKTIAKILDIKALLQIAFSNLTRKKTQTQPPKALIQPESAAVGSNNTEVLVTFEVAGQEFALPLNVVQEILPLPSSLTAVARSENAVLGITSVRDALMPLLSLRALLGFTAHSSSEREKVVVMKLGHAQVGLVADQARSILTADSERMEPVPAVIAARTGGESQIRSVYRGDAGQRLISILAPEQLFRGDVMQRLTTAASSSGALMQEARSTKGEELILLIFRLGDEEFGLPIDAVVEVAQVPAQITRVPKTPKFLEGVVNLRGEVLPVVDQRRRFDMPKLEQAEARRLIVLKTQNHRAGVIVDSVSDVLRTVREQVAPAPELTDEKTARLVHGVINLESAGRMILLLDPAELLTRAEQGLLETFKTHSKQARA